MMRLFAFSGILIWSGSLLAAPPVPAYGPVPAAAAPSMGVNQPLPTVVANGVPVGGYGSHGACPTCGACPTGRDRPCWERFKEWLCFRNGPRVLPVLTPTPYQAPLRAYFPCQPNGCYAVGGCTVGGSCASSGCDTGYRTGAPIGPVLGRWGLLTRATPGVSVPAPTSMPIATPYPPLRAGTPHNPIQPTGATTTPLWAR